MNGRSKRFFGPHVVAVAVLFSIAVSVRHVLVHEAPLVPTVLGQGAHVALSVLLGVVGYYVLTGVETPAERHTIGVQTGGGYVLTLLAAGGYSLHQHFSPEATTTMDVILFEMTFIGVVGGLAGMAVGLEKVQRRRTIADLEETTTALATTKTEIRTEKQRFESLFQNAPSAVADLQYTEGEATVERANDVFEELLEYTSADAEGKNLFQIVPLQETETEAEVAAHVAAGDIYEGEVTVEGADGLRHYKLRVIPYDVGKEGERAFALYTDVSELKQTKQELETSVEQLETTKAEIRTEKQRFESLFQNAPSAVADLQYTDGEPLVERANDVFEELLDHTSADVEGENLFRAVPLQETETEAEVAAHVAAGDIYEGEVTVEGVDGLRHYKLRVIPYDVGKAGERAFALYTDVSELRRTQQELEASVDQLETSNERLEQFAYAISHDLQEPLRMVSSYLQLIEERYTDELDEDGEEFIEFAVDGAERMQGMIRSLLEYSRVTTRGEPLEPTDSGAVLEDVLTDLEPAIEENAATITTGALPTVRADADQLGQVFQNLVSNALKYSGDEPPEICVDAEEVDDRWRFTVSDDGIGIDPAKHERIFQVFETAHTVEEGADSGIGLALCERIVERHGGDIWVESEPGAGASFSFTLPAQQGPEPVEAS